MTIIQSTFTKVHDLLAAIPELHQSILQDRIAVMLADEEAKVAKLVEACNRLEGSSKREE